MQALKDLELLINSRYPIIAVETYEEERVEGVLQQVAARLGIPLFVWTITEGLKRTGSDHPIYDTQHPLKALNNLAAIKNEGIYLFKDLHRYLGEAEVARKLQDLARPFAKDRRAIVLSAPQIALPPELEKLAARFRLDLPTEEDLKLLARDVIRTLSQQHRIKVELSAEEFDRLVESMKGLTLFEAERALTKAVLHDLALTRQDLDLIVEIKKELLEKDGVLEYAPPEESMAQVGGLQNLKNWLEKRKRAFAPEAERFGIPPPKGILLLGVQGCGKTMAAKAVAKEWHLPLLKLEPGRLYDKYIGESEKNLEKALRLAERMAPCVLMVDEIEKGFTYVGSSEADAGLSRRIFGRLLGWLQDRKAPVFVVACMTGDTVVARPDGTLEPIQEAGVGPVWAADFLGSGIVEARSPTKVNPTTSRVVEIATTGAILTCTPNHPLFKAAEAGICEVQAADLQVGDYVAAPLTLPEPRQHELELARPPVSPQANPVTLPTRLTEDVAYWVGYLTGDGGVARLTSAQAQRVQWSELSEAMVETYKRLTESLFGKRLGVHRRRTGPGYYLFLDSSSVGRWLEANFPDAICRGGPHRAVAQVVCRSPNRIVAAFLGGLFDAEGTCSSRRMALVTTSFVLVQQVNMLLRRLGIQATCERTKRRGAYTRNWVYRLTVSDAESIRAFARTIGVRHPEKRVRIDRLVEELQQRPVQLVGGTVLDVPVPFKVIDQVLARHRLSASFLPYYAARRSRRQSVSRTLLLIWARVLEAAGVSAEELKPIYTRLAFRWDRVKSVAIFDRTVPVFDLHVPEYHNYVAGGLIVHNTSNDITKLPPELVRKGRFDEIFFIDLPNREERKEIFAVHLRKRKRDPSAFDLDLLAGASEGFSGAEVEQAIVSALYTAFSKGSDLTTGLIVEELKATKPLSVTRKEEIAALRQWAQGRTVMAS